MRTANIGRNVHKFVSSLGPREKLCLIGLLALGSTFTVLADEAMNLNTLPAYSYRGEDDLRRDAGCHLEVEPVERDFANRLFQNFRVTVDGGQFAQTVVYRGTSRTLAPVAISGRRSRFRLSADGWELEMITPENDAYDILDFRLYDKTGIRHRLAVKCLEVRR